MRGGPLALVILRFADEPRFDAWVSMSSLRLRLSAPPVSDQPKDSDVDRMVRDLTRIGVLETQSLGGVLTHYRLRC